MSGFNFGDIAKKGWHPKSKDGKAKESWRGDFKGIDQISGWMGKDKKQDAISSSGDTSGYTPMPISSLRDPASFAPPPKRTNTAGSTGSVPQPTASSTASYGNQPSYVQPAPQAAQAEPEEERPPPQPYRRDTTGLSTSHLPPPPIRRPGTAGQTPPPGAPSLAPKPKPKPSLPPRLPPRQNENPNEHTPAPPPPYSPTPDPAHQGILNQGAVNRLGAAGVNVPGFGIGASPSPPLPARTPSERPMSPAKPSTPQLSELQSRFAKLNTSSSSNQERPAPAPSQGTSWAQKQAALKTASSFHKDPSSVSFSDAKNAASTANNFRERHGEQVASGWKSAQNLNTKYGLSAKAAKIGGYDGHGDSRQEASSQESGVTTPSVVGKKAPPPPPKKRPELGSAQQGSGPPPPIPIASKPKPNMPPYPTHPSAASSSPPSQQKDIDLDLPSAWFAKQPPTWPPPSLSRYPGMRSDKYSMGWSSSGPRKTWTLTGLLVHPSLAYTKIRLTWDGNAPAQTARAEQRHYAPPRELSAREVEEYRGMYNERVARWCEGQMGRQVGNGECWTLAHDALVAVAEDCKREGREPCMASQSYIHGFKIFETKTSPPYTYPAGGLAASGIARGDILQFWKAKFETTYPGGGRSWKSAGAPDHTSVVVGVEPNGDVRCLEQNVGGKKIVMEGVYKVGDLTEGEMRCFRPVPVSWLGEPGLEWP